MSPYLKIIVFIIDALNSISESLAKHHKISEVNNVVKAVDTNDDVALAKLLRDIADKVEQRKKTA